jgi:hypothetical protein
MMTSVFFSIVLMAYIFAGIMCIIRNEDYIGESKTDRFAGVVFFPLVYLCVYLDKKQNEKHNKLY